MNRLLVLLYGVVAYAIGMGGLVYFIVYVGGWPWIPTHVDTQMTDSVGQALLINLAIMLLFGIQHSVMARPSFKKAFTKVVTPAVERSTYVLLSGILMVFIPLFWQPLDGVLWDARGSLLGTLLTVGYASGWMLAVVSTFVINHFELFGLQQAYLHFKQKPLPAAWFTDRFLYKLVRHPLQLGILIGIWVVPTMTMTLFSLSLMMTIYIVIGLYFEEKDLVASLGDRYRDYQGRVPKLLPLPRPK